MASTLAVFILVLGGVLMAFGYSEVSFCLSLNTLARTGTVGTH